MAYNNGFPMNYQPIYPQYSYVPQQQVVAQQNVQQNDNGILWVQGEAGAKSWAVATMEIIPIIIRGGCLIA